MLVALALWLVLALAFVPALLMIGCAWQTASGRDEESGLWRFVERLQPR